jgi:hypothetical protein
MNKYKLTFENNRTCTIECEHSGKPLQDKINEAENRFNSPVAKINDQSVKKHNLGGFILGAVIGGMLGKSVPAHTVSKTAKSVKSNTKKVVRSVKKQVKKFDTGGVTLKQFYKTQPSINELEGVKVKNINTGTIGYLYLPDASSLGSTVWVDAYKDSSDNGKYHDVEDLIVLEDKHGSKFDVGGSIQEIKDMRDLYDDNYNKYRKSYLRTENVAHKYEMEKWLKLKKEQDELLKYELEKSWKLKKGSKYEKGGPVGSNEEVKKHFSQFIVPEYVQGSSKYLYKMLDPNGKEVKEYFVFAKSNLLPEFEKFKAQFEDKGYFLTKNNEKIPLDELYKYIKIIPYKQESHEFETYYADGGLVGKQIVFERYGEERIGKITEDLGDGRLSVVSGSGSHAITPENIVSFIDTPEKKKGWFSFKDGGKLVYHNGREYPTGSAWTKEHNYRNKSEKHERYDVGGPVIPMYMDEDGFVFNGSSYIHEPSGYTLELEFSEGDETDNGTLVEENLYVIYDNDGQMVSSDAEPLEVAKETLLDYISNEFGKGGPVGSKYKTVKSKHHIELAKKEILMDVQKGLVPNSVKSFSELNEYVDANEYGGFTKEDYQISKNYAIENAVQMELDKWIKSGGLKNANSQNKFDVGGPVGNPIEKRIKNLTKKGYIVKQTRKEPDGSWYYKIQTPENASNDAGMGIGYVANSHYYHHTHGADDNKTGNIWFHKNTNNRGRGTEYSFSENEINSLLDQKENQKFDVGGPVETSEQKYRLLSPDGFDIEMDAVYTQSELMPAFEKFKKRFEKQGYYSTSNRTKIDLRDLEDYMQVVEYNEIEDYN